MLIDNEARKMRADMMREIVGARKKVAAYLAGPLAFAMFVVLAIVFGKGEPADTARAATASPAQRVDGTSTAAAQDMSDEYRKRFGVQRASPQAHGSPAARASVATDIGGVDAGKVRH